MQALAVMAAMAAITLLCSSSFGNIIIIVLCMKYSYNDVESIHYNSKHLCLSSKAAILIISWATVIGTAYPLFKDLVAVSILSSSYAHVTDIAILDLSLIMIFYPLNGFICCGRFKIASHNQLNIDVILLHTFRLCISLVAFMQLNQILE